jgi:hypothetical protein
MKQERSAVILRIGGSPVTARKAGSSGMMKESAGGSNPRMSPTPPLITLTTDFGTRDPYLGALRGALLSACPGAQLVDIGHDLPPYDRLAGAYLLGAAAPWFPPGTVHLAVVDPGVGGPRRALAISAGGSYFVGPDNGLFTAIYDRLEVVELRAIDAPRLGLGEVHPTFHGRDLFAPAAGRLARGMPLAELGPALSDPVRLPVPAPRREGARLSAGVLHVDRFGNVATNLTRDALARSGTGVDALGWAGGPRPLPVHRTFSDAPPGELFLLWGSSGYLELALDQGSAAAHLGLTAGESIEFAVLG